MRCPYEFLKEKNRSHFFGNVLKKDYADIISIKIIILDLERIKMKKKTNLKFIQVHSKCHRVNRAKKLISLAEMRNHQSSTSSAQHKK